MVIDRFDNWLDFINGDIINVATEWNNMEYEDQKGEVLVDGPVAEVPA